MGLLSFLNINKTKEKLIDYVYVCHEGDNEQLRYSIRSVIENGPAGNIWIVGGKPDWYTGNFIFVEKNRNKYTHVRSSLNAIINSELIKDDFILMNDDFFIMNKVDKIQYFYSGTLDEKILLYQELIGSSSYVNKLIQTLNKLQRYNINQPIDYELHVPFPINKQNLHKILNKNDKLLYRSFYGNMFDVGGLKIEDVKVYDRTGLIKKSFDYKKTHTDFLSTTDSSFNTLEPMLKEKFPNKSHCEK
jgi:hypothetical protein